MRSTKGALQGGSVPKHPHSDFARISNTAKKMNQGTQEIHLKVLRHLEENPKVSQRELAKELGVSLGKANYCLKALIDKGLIKANNFKNSANKRAYLYKLTPKGLETKARVSVRFLQRKIEEYEALKLEIEQLQNEINQ